MAAYQTLERSSKSDKVTYDIDLHDVFLFAKSHTVLFVLVDTWGLFWDS